MRPPPPTGYVALEVDAGEGAPACGPAHVSVSGGGGGGGGDSVDALGALDIVGVLSGVALHCSWPLHRAADATLLIIGAWVVYVLVRVSGVLSGGTSLAVGGATDAVTVVFVLATITQIAVIRWNRELLSRTLRPKQSRLVAWLALTFVAAATVLPLLLVMGAPLTKSCVVLTLLPNALRALH